MRETLLLWRIPVEWNHTRAINSAVSSSAKADDPVLRSTAGITDRGREHRLASTPPPSEPDVRISRIRLSGWWSYLREDRRSKGWASPASSEAPVWFAPSASVLSGPAVRSALISVRALSDTSSPAGNVVGVVPHGSDFTSPPSCTPSLPRHYPASSLLWVL